MGTEAERNDNTSSTRMTGARLNAAVLALLFAGSVVAAQPLRVPAYTAYLEPNPEGAHVSSKSGITGWSDPSQSVVWYADFKHGGELECSVALHLPSAADSHLRLTVGDTTREAVAKGQGTNLVVVSFGGFHAGAGYQRLALQSLNASGADAGNIDALLLEGPASEEAHFNFSPRRNAASVHLFYPTDGLTNITAFYCEVTALADPIWTYYMACGWHRGYFGMQVNSPTERRIIFSVWDSGGEGVDRAKVAREDRVSLVKKGEGVEAGDFGNEGTGGHSHLVYPWKTGAVQRFLVTSAVADATHIIFSGFYFHPEKKKWELISSWNAPKEKRGLSGLYSFSENFGGANGQLRRKACFGNQWVRTGDGAWHELCKAKFSYDATGRADRQDRFMGVENGCFFLSQGGFIEGSSQFGQEFQRPAVTHLPEDLLRWPEQAAPD